MADWPSEPIPGGRMAGVWGSSTGPVVCSASTANTYGSWVQAYSALPFDSQGFWVAESSSGAPQSIAFDIGAGASGSETAVVSGFWKSAGCGMFYLPVSIPAGTRVAVRSKPSTSATSTTYFQLMPVAGGFMSQAGLGNVIDIYGLSAMTGTTVLAGSLQWTMGSWVQLTASTTRRHKALMLAGSFPSVLNNIFGLDIGVGASGSETLLVPTSYQMATGTNNQAPPVMGPYQVDVPAGSRLSVRLGGQAASSNTTVVLYGLS